MSIVLPVLLALAFLAAPTTGQDMVRVTTIEGKSYEGIWIGVTENNHIELKTEDEAMKLFNELLMQIQWPAHKPQKENHGFSMIVETRDGSRLRANLKTIEGKSLLFETDLVPRLSLPLSTVTAVYKSNDDKEAAEALKQAIDERHPSQDTLLMQREGDVRVLKGVTDSLNAEGGVFRWRNRSLPIDWNKTFGVVFAGGIGQVKRQPVRCTLMDGSVWAGKLSGGDKTAICLTLTDGTTISIAVSNLAAIHFVSDRLVYLDEIKPDTYKFEPFASTKWPYRLNRSVANRPMRIGGEQYDRGIGVHSRSILEYQLKEPFKQLAAVIGIDEAVGDLGSVVFRVHADETVVFDSGPVTGRDEPRAITVPIEGAKRLKLEVDFGETLDVGDQANWANIRLIR
jgi:hypothetical protein